MNHATERQAAYRLGSVCTMLRTKNPMDTGSIVTFPSDILILALIGEIDRDGRAFQVQESPCARTKRRGTLRELTQIATCSLN
jgi:hypothetical protein